MPIYRDRRLASGREPATVETPVKRTYAPAGRCVACQCVLSKYRTPSETRCATCERAYQKRLLDEAVPDRYEEARRLLAEGWTYHQVAVHLGWRTRQACSSAIRYYEIRRGLPHAAEQGRVA